MSLKAFNSLPSVLTIKQLNSEVWKIFQFLVCTTNMNEVLGLNIINKFAESSGMPIVKLNTLYLQNVSLCLGSRKPVTNSRIRSMIIWPITLSFSLRSFQLHVQFIVRKEEPMVFAHRANYDKKTLARQVIPLAPGYPTTLSSRPDITKYNHGRLQFSSISLVAFCCSQNNETK